MCLGESAIAPNTEQCPERLLAMPNASHYAALQVIHDAIAILATWAKVSFPTDTDQTVREIQPFINAAKEILNWSSNEPETLRLVFDQIQLSDASHHSENYRPAWALHLEGNEQTPRIPYPQTRAQAEVGLEALKSTIRKEITHLKPDNLAQLTLFLEKFGSHISVGEADVAVIDQARSTAALAAALAQNPLNQKLALIAGDLTGVQKFIYTIASDGALKSLRARSFYLELTTEEIVHQLLDCLQLPRTNIIYAGASKFYLLAAATDATKQAVEQIQEQFNQWLLDEFQRKVYLAMDWVEFSASDLKPQPDTQATDTLLSTYWRAISHKLSEQSSRKFQLQIKDVLKIRPSHTPCKVCHRDDVRKLTRLKRGEPDSIEACATCARMFRLGGQLLRVKAIVRSSRRNLSETRLRFKLKSGTVYHYLFNDLDEAFRIAAADDLVLLVNNWDVRHYQTSQVAPLLYANYAQPSKVEFEENDPKKPGTMQAEEFTQEAEGIKRIGYLRMDVDRLSQIFAKGLGENYTLPRLASLSRQMSYFFKVYLNSLAAYRGANFTDHQNADGVPKFKTITPLSTRKNLLFIYAGGDDLFVSGAWNEAVEFAFDVYQAFRAYTGQHPDITLSAGVYLADAKFPLYQAAKKAGDIEQAAKGNGRDSLGLFNAALKWDEWLGNWNPKVLKPDDLAYLNSPIRMDKPALFGVLPFIKHLYGEVGHGYTRSFVRNLLNTAQLQEAKIKEKQEKFKEEEKKIKEAKEKSEGTADEWREAENQFKEIKEKHPEQMQDIRYYLHLPRVAYTLARLPDRVLADTDFRQSFKSPYNAPYFRAIATWIELLNRNS